MLKASCHRGRGQTKDTTTGKHRKRIFFPQDKENIQTYIHQYVNGHWYILAWLGKLWRNARSKMYKVTSKYFGRKIHHGTLGRWNLGFSGEVLCNMVCYIYWSTRTMTWIRSRWGISCFKPTLYIMCMALQTQKRKGRQSDSLGIHWRRWSLSSTSPVNTRAVILTTFPFQWKENFSENMWHLCEFC